MQLTNSLLKSSIIRVSQGDFSRKFTESQKQNSFYSEIRVYAAVEIIILCKRSPQKRDLWERPYGRFYHIAKLLASKGDSVHLVLLSYSRREEFTAFRDGFMWHSVNLLPNPLRYYLAVQRLINAVRPDWIVGFSDTYFGICAGSLGRRAKIKVLIDAYDNYESYVSWCLPLHWLWRRALRHSNAITAAGPQLLNLMTSTYGGINTEVIEMSADPQFTPGLKSRARQALGLPLNRPLVVYSGSLSPVRGEEELMEVIKRVGQVRPDILWVLSGRMTSDASLPKNCRHLGYVSDEKVVEIFRSSDLVLSVNKPGRFGDFGYPVKIYEALAVGSPVIAFFTESTGFVMRENTSGLINFGDINAIVEKIVRTLDSPYDVVSPTSGWDQRVDLLRRGLINWN